MEIKLCPSLYYTQFLPPPRFSDLPPSLAQGHHLKNLYGLDSPRCSFNREKSMYLSMIIAWFVVFFFFKMPKKGGKTRWRLRSRAILTVCPAWCLQNSRGSGRHLLKLLLLGHWKSSKSHRLGTYDKAKSGFLHNDLMLCSSLLQPFFVTANFSPHQYYFVGYYIGS